MKFRVRMASTSLLILWSAIHSLGQQTESSAARRTNSTSPEDAKYVPDRQIAATVNDYEISNQAAIRMLKRLLPNQDSLSSNPVAVQTAVERLVERRVVYEYLVANERAAGKNEIKLELETFKTELKAFDQSLEQYLSENSLTLAELEFEFAWPIAWNRFLKKQLTDEYLQEYFAEHRREFDDSEMRVAHLLVKTHETQSIEAATSTANRILVELKSGSTTWEAAVRQNSNAPTRDSGGEMGWIRFDEPMPPEFSVAAFRLAVDEVSPPVVTSFGVHLIKCLELRPGKTGWRDALDRLQEHAARSLFREIAAANRSKVKVQFDRMLQ